MKQDFLKRLLFASLVALIFIILYFGAQYRSETIAATNTHIQVVVFTVLVVLMESALYAWRKHEIGVAPHRSTDGVYAVLFFVVVAVAYFLTRLVGRLLFHFFP